VKQLLTQLEARIQRAASRLDAAVASLSSWSITAPSVYVTVVNAEPGFVAIPTATDVHARRPQEPSP
jgi:hypothetical protein